MVDFRGAGFFFFFVPSLKPSILLTAVFLGAWRGDETNRQDFSGFGHPGRGDSVLFKGFVTAVYPHRPSGGALGETSPFHARDAREWVGSAEGSFHLGQVPRQSINSLGL